MLNYYDSPEALLADITEIMHEADRLTTKTRRIYFAKTTGELDDEDAEPNRHGRTKAQHHQRMAQLHDKLADQHSAMADHYSSGAKGAHTDDAEDEAIRSPIEQIQDDEPTDARSIVAKCL